MRKRSFTKRPDQIGYWKALQLAFEQLNMEEEEIKLLFDVLANKIPIKQLCSEYKLSKEEIMEKVVTLQEQLRQNQELLEVREQSNKKGIKK